jgi:two-component system, NarL family, response regulator NreC
MSLRVLVADDHPVVRGGLRKILEAEPSAEIVGEAGDGRQAVKLALDLHPDVAVLDIGMPLLNGIEATRQIVKRAPQVKVLILSMQSNEAFIIQALRAGAKGYLLKDCVDVDLARGIRAVSQGKSFFSPAVAKVMLDDYVRQMAEKGMTDRYDSLSEREREVFQLIAEGRANKEIAELLFISVSTVETHRAHIMEKLDLHSAAEIVLYAVRKGVIS